MFLLLIAFSFENFLNGDYLINQTAFGEGFFLSAVNGGLFGFYPGKDSFIHLDKSKGLLSNNVRFVTSNDTELFVLTNQGITIFNQDIAFKTNIIFDPSVQQDTLAYSIFNYSDTIVITTNSGILVWDRNSAPMDAKFYSLGYAVYFGLVFQGKFYLAANNGIYNSNIISGPYNHIPGVDTTTFSLVIKQDTVFACGNWGVGYIAGDSICLRNTGIRGLSYKLRSYNNILYDCTNAGVFKLNSSVWRKIGKGDKILNIKDVFIHQDSIYTLTYGRGIGWFKDSIWDYIHPPGPADNEISDFAQDSSGTIWMAHGMSNYRNFMLTSDSAGIWKVYNRDREWNISGRLWQVEAGKGKEIWLGVWGDNGGLYRWEHRDSIPEKVQLNTPRDVVADMETGPDGNLYVSFLDNTIVKIEIKGDSIIPHYYTNREYFKWVRAIAFNDEGDVYCGFSPGLSEIGITIIHPDGSLEKVASLPSFTTLSITRDIRNHIWAGLEGCAVVIEGKDVIKVYNKTDGLMDDRVDGIEGDFQGGMWFFHREKGMSYLRPDGEWRYFRTNDGLISTNVQDGTDPIFFSKAHKLYIGTDYGLSVLTPDFNIPSKNHIVNVYPNPFIQSKDIYVNFASDSLPGKNIFIFTPSGKLLYKGIIQSNVFQWEVNNIQSGILLYRITDDRGVFVSGSFVIIK